MFAVIVRFTIKSGSMQEFLPLMHQNATASVSLEPECRQFDVLTDPANADEVVLYEIYENEAAFGAHLAAPHFLAFDRQVARMIEHKTVEKFRQVQ